MVDLQPRDSEGVIPAGGWDMSRSNTPGPSLGIRVKSRYCRGRIAFRFRLPLFSKTCRFGRNSALAPAEHSGMMNS